MNELLKVRFLALYRMILADGVIDARELETLYRIGKESYNLTSQEINEMIVSAGTSFVKPEKLEDQIGILYQLSEIAWSDGKIDDSERTLLITYAKRFDFLNENAEAIAEFFIDAVKNKVSVKEVLTQII